MFPRKLLIYKRSKETIRPFFLSCSNPEHLGIAQIAIDFYESNLGKPRSQIQFEELRYQVGYDKLADGLRSALERRYRFVPDQPKLKYKLSPLELRLELFKLVGSLPGGFSQDRKTTLAEFASKHGIPMSLEELEEYLWADDPREYLLIRSQPKPQPQDLIRDYNFEVLDTLLFHSKLIKAYAWARAGLGALAKQLGRIVRELGLIYDARMEGSKLCMEIYGPIELFGRPTKFAWRLGILFHRMLPLLRACSYWSWVIQVWLRRRSLNLELNPRNIPELPSELGAPIQQLESIFDSQLEQRFYQAFCSAARLSSGAISRIEREYLPIALGDLLVIPDFTILNSKGEAWHLEVIGYWRPEYTAKKRAKLQQLSQHGFRNLILLVDKKYLEHFKDLGFPVFGYKISGERLDFPIGSVLSLILGR